MATSKIPLPGAFLDIKAINASTDLDDLHTDSKNPIKIYSPGGSIPINAPSGASTYAYVICLGGLYQIWLSPSAIFVRRYSGNPAYWHDWYKYTGTAQT